MLYLKYRPKKISEIDNLKIRDQLSKILKSKNLPHAFLFFGQRGTGKTSAARIIARSVNCFNNYFAQKGEDVEPCGSCRSCLSIDQGSNPDVFELDAASNRGIDEVRGLINEANFSPMIGRFRVFIIDEAHMITHEGFNALLKTLEEPPRNSIFILATTDEEKIPRTIVSRCLRINFSHVKETEIVNMLKKICQMENRIFPDELLGLIAKSSEGSFRDAVKILEQAMVMNIKTKEELESLIGIFSKETLIKYLEAKDQKSSLQYIQDFVNQGGDVKALVTFVLERLRVALLYKKGVLDDKELDLNLTEAEIKNLIKLFLEAYQNLKLSPISSIPLEIAIVEFYNFGN